MIADLFKTHPPRSVKNANIILQNVHAINVNQYLLLGLFKASQIGSNKREEMQNIGTNLEIKLFTLLNDAMVFKLVIQIKDTLLRMS